ncbi:MAG TPA: DUF2764 family protein [Kiritimatiellia bacterium]|nr:DUF2764 family protein [Kiritimatiellia bacterium]HMP00152.1 DUF2764 family protein [Kiritimatiellia bacterium]HMP96906.1 DUF2764 family protein [Kiritimatiellia bacterium]
MAAQYYYLVSSLPGLTFSSPAALSRAAFVEACRSQLAEPDLAEVAAVIDGRRDDLRTEAGRVWIDADRQLRNAIVRQRALRLGVDEKKHLKEHQGFRVDAEDAVSDAFSRANPLERELALDRFRWNLAEELALSDPFGLPAVLAYAVKLEINEHWQSLTAEKGRDRLEEMLEVVGVSSEEAAGWGGLAQL